MAKVIGKNRFTQGSVMRPELVTKPFWNGKLVTGTINTHMTVS